MLGEKRSRAYSTVEGSEINVCIHRKDGGRLAAAFKSDIVHLRGQAIDAAIKRDTIEWRQRLILTETEDGFDATQTFLEDGRCDSERQAKPSPFR